MLAHPARMRAFKETIDTRVLPGARVIELGAGTGVLSYFAAKRGATVTCVERLPEVAAAARRFLALNGVDDRVKVVEGDAKSFEPRAPADIVICEMLHVGLLREQQARVIDRFKERYVKNIGLPLPLFVPESSVLAVQPVYHSFDFMGYRAAVPMFYEPLAQGDPTEALGDPLVYSVFDYGGRIPKQVAFKERLPINRPGYFNALRFITKNVVGLFPNTGKTADWFMQFMVLPLPTPVTVAPGQDVTVSFSYAPGDEIGALQSTLTVA